MTPCLKEDKLKEGLGCYKNNFWISDKERWGQGASKWYLVVPW